MRPPRIGLTLRARPAADARGSDRAAGWWLHDALLQRCAEHGALAWPLAAPAQAGAADIVALARAQVEELDALVLGGGGDILHLPDGRAIQAGASALDVARDRFEYALLAAALARGLPVLGICRGAQLIHRAGGGDLEVADATGEALHLDVERYVDHHHAIELAPGSWLADGHARTLAEVNSAHRWRIVEPLPGARVLARCPVDASVEAFELADAAFVVGLMWHPEFALAHARALRGDAVFARLHQAIACREL